MRLRSAEGRLTLCPPHTQCRHCWVHGLPDSSQSSAQHSSPESQPEVSTMMSSTAGVERQSQSTATKRNTFDSRERVSELKRLGS